MNQYCYLPYTISLNSPAIVTTQGGDPNSSSTLSYISGAVMRGAVAKVLGDPAGNSVRQREFHDLILGGSVHYLNAYPIVDNMRTLPTPVSLRLRKDEPENTRKIIDLSACDSDRWPMDDLISISEEFLSLGAAQPKLFNPKISARIHHQRDRAKGHAGKDRGAIFTFESLDAGQLFAGLILLRCKQKAELDHIESRIKELLGSPILLGRSRRAGYGGMAVISWGKSQNHETEAGGRDGLRPLNRDIEQGEQFRFLLTSQCIVRNPVTGQIDPAALEKMIVDRISNRVETIRKIWTFAAVSGFNRKWRLELPQTLAVSAGSIFVLKANQAISQSELHMIEHEALGERKEEGYGRFLFLDAPSLKISLEKYSELPSEVTKANPPMLITDIEKRIVRNQITRKIEETAACFAQSAKNLPTNSLIGRLRTPLRGAAHKAITTLRQWLTGEETDRLKRPALEQLERCQIDNGRTLHSWILEAMDKDTVLNWLKVGILAQRFCLVSKESAMIGVENNSEELSIRLIDAVLADLAILRKTREVVDGQ